MDAEELVRKLSAWRELMGRVHDESTWYVLPDKDIVALVSEPLTTTMGIDAAIAQNDLGTKLRSSAGQIGFEDGSSSGVICSHYTDIHQILQGGNLDDVLPILLEKCLGTEHGTCPITVFNSSLLESFKTKNGFKQLTRKASLTRNASLPRKASREKEVSLKSTLYDNWSIYTKDGRLLGSCDRKKVEWYVKRGLAEEVAEKPLAIKFVFETEAQGQDFNMQSKKNVCVGCEEENQYQRFRIVPSCYRDHFPEHMKSHRSHDIVLLCLNCHRLAYAAAERYKTEIAQEFKIPLFVQRTSQSEDVAAVRRAAAALLQHGNRMPSSRCQELLETVKTHYGGRDISKEDLEKAVHIVSVDGSSLGHGVHGQQIVQSLLKEYGEDGLQKFCQRWRKVFVKAVHPRHLPHGWNVSNKL